MRRPPLNWGKTKERLEAALLDPLARIIPEFEDKRSLLCYKHVD